MSLIPSLTQISDGDSLTATPVMANLNLIRTVVNGDIDNTNISSSAAIAISKTALGTYTAWTTYAPTYGAGGSMTWGTVTTNIARYTQIGKTVIVQISASGTTGGVANTFLTVSLPITATQTTSGLVTGGARVGDGSGTVVGGYFFNADGTTIRIYRYDGAAFGLGTLRSANFQCSYEVS